MKAVRRDLATTAFSRLDLTPANRQLADYWLSLWNGEHLPKRADLSPARMTGLLPGIGIFEIRAGVSSRCRLSGTAIQRALGLEMAGLDWRDYTPKDQWAARLERNSMIANGAVGIGVRHATLGTKPVTSQELQLPFADETEDGAQLILFHLDWRPRDTLYEKKSLTTVRIADEFHALPLVAD